VNKEVLSLNAGLYGPALQLVDSGNQLMELTPGGSGHGERDGEHHPTHRGPGRVRPTRPGSCIYAKFNTLVRCYDANTAPDRNALPGLFTSVDTRPAERPSTTPSGTTDNGDLSSLSGKEVLDRITALTEELRSRQG
jgi:hypothetical protein